MQCEKTAFTTALLSAGLLGLTGCGGGGGSDDDGNNGGGADAGVTFDARALIQKQADGIITTTYDRLNAEADDLVAAVEALVTDGATEAEMNAAQQAWKDARVPWESSEGFLFGPVDSLGVDPAIDSWPLNTPDLAQFLRDNPDATRADIENASDDLRGFHAMEYLLFGDGVNDNDKAATELTEAERNYLVALARAFEAQTQRLADAWTVDFNGRGPYAGLLETAGENTVYASRAAVVEELINGLITIADETSNAKMVEPFGPSISGYDTSLVESQYSWNSLTDFHNNFQSILNAYTGKLGYDPATDSVSNADNGLYAFVHAHDATLADRLLAEIIDAQQKIALIKGDGNPDTTEINGTALPFREQIKDPAGRVLVQDAIDAGNTVLTTLETEVLPLVPATDFAD